MPAEIYLKNAEVMKSETRETRSGKTLLSMLVKYWSKIGEKDGKPQFNETQMPVTIFNPDGLSFKSGDKIDVKGQFKVTTNPTYVQVKRELLNGDAAFEDKDLKDSRWPEVTAFPADVTLLEAADPTKKKDGAAAKKPYKPRAKAATKTAAASDDPWAGSASLYE